MLTRAICLLIIVGNHRSLQAADDKWAELIRFCSDNNALMLEGRRLHDRITFIE